MTYKRYQYWSSDGLKFTKWFKYSGERYIWQDKKRKLINEYKEE